MGRLFCAHGQALLLEIICNIIVISTYSKMDSIGIVPDLLFPIRVHLLAQHTADKNVWKLSALGRVFNGTTEREVPSQAIVN
jgi:hypothetical protein